MRPASKEKPQTINDGVSRTTKSRKTQNALRKRCLQYIEILDANAIKQVEIKENFKMSILEEPENYSRQNLVKGVYTWAVPLVRYSRTFLKRIREDLKKWILE